MRILGYGDNFIDKFIDRRTYYPGGNAVNVAVFTAALGAQSAYLGAFGDDELAEHLRATLAELGIATDLCPTRHGETGWAEVKVVDGDRVFVGWNEGGITAQEPLTLGAPELAYAAGFDLVHSGVYAWSPSEIAKLAGIGPLVSFDFSEEDEFRSDAYLGVVCPAVDLALFSGGERDLDGLVATLKRAVEAGAGMAVGTRGPLGSVLFDGNRLYEQVAPPVTDPVDTMGCGDAFLAAFVVNALRGSWAPGVPMTDAAIVNAMSLATEFAARQTLTEGAFHHGRRY